MKLLSLLGAFISLVFMSSSISLSGREVRVGEQAPDFKVENALEAFRMSDAHGKRVTVTFWSASDPESRIRNNRMANAAADATDHVYVGICIDADRQLAREIVRRDGLKPGNQFMLADVKMGDPGRDYETSTGLLTFEVDEYGNIQNVSME